MSLEIFKRKKMAIVLITAFFLIIATAITITSEYKYLARSRVIVVQDFPVGTDPYSVTKANEQLTSVLSEVIKSNDFYEQALAAGFDFDESYFKEGKTSEEELKLWQKTAIPGVVSATQSIIEIRVYHPEKQQALEISSAVISVLKNKHSLYHNPEDKTQIMEIDKADSFRQAGDSECSLEHRTGRHHRADRFVFLRLYFSGR
jgi:capsular polysaccharide biosynthesis protein